jgi:predicted nuclease with TOPRIM domain
MDHFKSLSARIARNEKIMRMLEKENAILQAQIRSCESKVKAYPKVKKRYDKLAQNLERANRIEATAKKH